MTFPEMRALMPGAVWRAVLDTDGLQVGSIITGPGFRYMWRVVTVSKHWVTIEKVAPESCDYCWKDHTHHSFVAMTSDGGWDSAVCICGCRMEEVAMLLPDRGQIKAFVTAAGEGL